MERKILTAPGQKRSSSARSWLVSATRVCTRSSRARHLARRVLHDHVVLLRRPVDARETTFHSYSSLVRSSQRPDHEVPLRALIDRPSNGATSCCHFWHLTPAGRGWSNAGPLTGKLERPSPGGGRGHRDLNGRDYIRMTNELQSRRFSSSPPTFIIFDPVKRAQARKLIVRSRTPPPVRR